ncbi:MAG: HIT family protein [Neisseriaceae bacterium]|nr:HIT family protein [Neisseriaceae bacterium]MBP6861234.1 HIT family protein [Neisseriaceae bacterium]
MSYDSNNIFAKIIRGEAPSFKVYEDEHTYVLMDIMPQSTGHTLILTKEPAATMFELSTEAAQACIATAKKIAPALMAATGAQGLTVCQFNGAVAGQTVDHVHYHLIPRYEGESMNLHAKEVGDLDAIKALGEKIAAGIQA